MTGGHLQDARVEFDSTGRRSIGFTLTPDGQAIFSMYTKDHVGDVLAITLDGVVISAPVIQSHIPGREGQITSGDTQGFKVEEAESIAIKLKYGALPIALHVIQNRTIGPSLGKLSIELSTRAGIIGIVVTIIFLLIYYRVPGFFAALALGLYALMNFSLYKLIPVTLTVPGITGFILSIGMAVDANILVFERLKEELRAGRSIRRGIEEAFQRAWPSIRDGNFSTLITCGVLFWFGSNFGASMVKGFAVTLALGVVINLFTAVTVTRALFRLGESLLGTSMQNNSKLLLGLDLDSNEERPTPVWLKNLFQIVEKRNLFYIFSTTVIGLGIIAMSITAFTSETGSPLPLSIDYVGGTLWELRFDEDVDVDSEKIRTVFDTFGEGEYKGTGVQNLSTDHSFLVRTENIDVEEKTLLMEAMRKDIGNFEEMRFESVGPVVGEEVTQASSVAVSVASVLILLFIWYAFRAIPNAIRYGVGAIVALLHDILVTAGIFAILGLILDWEVNALFLTAILTVIGYSVNDTIVVFDRMRENIPRRRNETFESIANRSLLETLQRSMATSLSTLFVIGAVLFYGGTTTTQFMAVMLIGIISGTYSSIFTAVPFLVSWRKGDFGKLMPPKKPAQAEVVG